MSASETTTRRITVNAAFLKDIKDDNHDLKVLWDRIIPMAQHEQTAINHWNELVSLLSDLRDQLAFHFSLEEAYGYFDEALHSAPQLSLDADMLRKQHPKLFEQICAIADRATEVRPDAPEKIERLLRQFHQFRQAFETHEEAELKLILDALGDDIGVGD